MKLQRNLTIVDRLRQIVSIGVTVDHDESETRRIRMVNFGAFLAIFSSAGFSIVHWQLGNTLFAFTTLIFIAGYVAAIAANAKGKRRWASVIVMVSLNLHVFRNAAEYGSASGGHLFFLPPLVYPLLVFSYREKKEIIVSMAGSLLLLMAAVLIHRTVGSVFTMDPVVQARLYDATLINVFALLLLILLYFYIQTGRIEQNLIREKERSDTLLFNMMPQTIAERMKVGNRIIADEFDECSILFADIVNFSRLTRAMSPERMVIVLNEFFQCFDTLVAKHSVEKIRTVGDGYFVASGVPDPRPDHLEALCELGLDMIDAARVLSHDVEVGIQVRIGIASGPVVAGVIGQRKYMYDLWGDAVNLASRMETQGEPGRIQMPAFCAEKLKDKYVLLRRGEIEIKSFGPTVTYFLAGKKSESSPVQITGT